MPRRRAVPILFHALAAGALALGVSACGSSDDGASGDALPVVATTTVVADIVENVGGDDIEVTTLVGRDVDAHTFEPDPADAEAIANAEIVFENGLGFEEAWLDDTVEASGTDAEVVELAEGVETIEFDGEEEHDHEEEAEHDEEEGAEHEDEEEAEHEHSHEGADPHVWMIAGNGIVMAENAAEALAEADPDNAEAYRERAEEYVAELEATGAEIDTILAAIPEDQRILFTNHDAFGYFAKEYGFEVLGSALNSLTTAGADPSAADVAAAVTEIEEAGVPAIFPENITNSDTLETIAREADVEIGPPLATGALGEEGSDTDTYIGLLTSNARSVAEYLGGTS